MIPTSGNARETVVLGVESTGGTINPTVNVASAPARGSTTTACKGAHDMFYCGSGKQNPQNTEGRGQGAPAPSPTPVATGLRYRIQRLEGDRPRDVGTDLAFRAGDRVRFILESNTGGFLYVVQQGSSGNWTVLFPSPQINGGRNTIKSFQPYTVPASGYFAFDETPGTERVFLYLSKVPLDDLPGMNEPVTKVETSTQARVDELSRRVATRDLVLETTSVKPAKTGSTPGNYVVNQNERAREVAVKFELIHR
jgi:hypothetical protein